MQELEGSYTCPRNLHPAVVAYADLVCAEIDGTAPKVPACNAIRKLCAEAAVKEAHNQRASTPTPQPKDTPSWKGQVGTAAACGVALGATAAAVGAFAGVTACVAAVDVFHRGPRAAFSLFLGAVGPVAWAGAQFGSALVVASPA